VGGSGLAAVIASQQAITASPISAATAAVIGLLAAHHIGLVQILMICVPSTLIAVFIASLVQLRVGKELRDDPEYQKRLASGEVETQAAAGREASAPLKAGSMTSALVFLAGVALVVLAGLYPELRTVPGGEKPLVLSMPISIAIVMMAVAAIILTVTKAPVAEVPRCKTCQSGITAIIGILGLAYVQNSIGLVTALNPVLGYEKSASIAKEALVTNRSVYQLVLEKNLLTQAQLDDILKPENMTHPRKSTSRA
jgi:anaerobic C4-dicarboxylate transporter DcuA